MRHRPALTIGGCVAGVAIAIGTVIYWVRKDRHRDGRNTPSPRRGVIRKAGALAKSAAIAAGRQVLIGGLLADGATQAATPGTPDTLSPDA